MQNRLRAASSLVVASTLMLLALAACGGGKDRAEPTGTVGGATTATRSEAPTSIADSVSQATPSQLSPEAAAAAVPSLTPVVYPTLGAAAQFDSNHDDALTWDEYQLAVAAAFEAFPWPPTYIVTPELILAAWPTDAHEAGFQPGFELDNIALWANCAWEMTWLDSRQSGDTQLEAEALNYIVTFLPTEYSDAGSISLAKIAGEKAALGDPSAIVQRVKANCLTINLQKAAPYAMPSPLLSRHAHRSPATSVRSDALQGASSTHGIAVAGPSDQLYGGQ